MMKKFLVFGLTFLFYSSNVLHAHGVMMSTASVQLRQKDHLSIELNYDPLLVHYLSYKRESNNTQKIPLLPQLAGMNQHDFEVEYKKIKKTIIESFEVRFNTTKLKHQKFYFPPAKVFHKSIRDKFEAEVMGTHEHHRTYYQTLYIDGFIAKNVKPISSALEIDFAYELGKVLVTYSEPKSQTLVPKKSGSHYRLLIIK